MADYRLSDLSGQPLEKLRLAMIDAFSDYVAPMQPTASKFAFMMRQRGLRADLSVGAFLGNDLVAIWLVAQEGEKGYLISNGTRPDLRGQGLARAMAAASFNRLRAAGVRRFETEVISGNSAAERLYARLGMTQERRLSCYTFPDRAKTARGSGFDIVRCGWSQIRAGVGHCRDWQASWQLNDQALDRAGSEALVFAVEDGQGLAGYAVLLRPNGQVAQIAVRPDQRRRGMGRALMAAAGQAVPELPLRVINADAGDGGFATFMAAVGGQHFLEQIAMSGDIGLATPV